MHPAEQIAIIIGRIYRSGMTTTSGGNVSIMDDNGDIWITPAGIDKGSLTPADIICVKPDGTVIGPHRPSSEYPFHRALYKIRPKMHSVIHAHPPGLVTFSIVHQIPDTSIIPQARSVCGPVGFAPYALPGSELLGEKIAHEFKKNPDYKAVIMENHGVVLMGEDIADAYQRFETLELCARTILNAKTLGEPKFLTEEQILRHGRAEIPYRGTDSAARAGHQHQPAALHERAISFRRAGHPHGNLHHCTPRLLAGPHVLLLWNRIHPLARGRLPHHPLQRAALGHRAGRHRPGEKRDGGSRQDGQPQRGPAL